MKKDKEPAIELRKQGNSYQQISARLSIPKSTLSVWLKDLQISPIAQEKINSRAYTKSATALIKRNKAQTNLAKERAEKIRNQAKQEFNKLVNNKLFLTGISLYWAEGSKWKCVDFANSDPQMIILMMHFFRTIFSINNEKFRIQIIAHPNIDINKSIDYWSELTNISKNQFTKTCCSINLNSQNKRRSNLTHGTVHIRINDVKLFFRIIGWIDGLKLYFLTQNI